MSEKTAKVTGILGCRKVDGAYGTTYYHTLELDNGETGSIGKKTENAFKIGDSLTYTSEESQFGLKFKAVVPNNGFGGRNGGGGSRGSTASFSLSYAKDIVIAAMPHHPDKTVNEWVEATKMIAGKLNTWLKENE